jgi:class 3 adenylate cyclase
VAQIGGRVATKLGDGLMALFGQPIAQKNDSERAVRAALRIQNALAELNRHNAGLGRPELVARIGIESGAVVDAAGEIFGDAPNSAARVQTLADPGTMLITARVQRQVAGLFVGEDRCMSSKEYRGRSRSNGSFARAAAGRDETPSSSALCLRSRQGERRLLSLSLPRIPRLTPPEPDLSTADSR